ncbi:hypothetical protein N7450_004022 [Penicillium hetheringtonii]|uniref:Rhodopsin domain-containing protein n=1 Tax=Penicillium hetheringtonii TaxID=911720 RepID=A0AAD6DQ13_9EURO|nr:hypothetical protein N7450_004022 [Penicillium hetheringtonii]
MSTDIIDERSSKISQPVFIGILWALTDTSFFFVLFRVYVQISSFRRLFLDDFLVIFAWVIILSAAVIWHVEHKALYELYAISSGTKPFDFGFLPRFNEFMRLLAPLQILFYSSLWCVKFSFLVFFYRLCSRIKAFRIWWYVVLFCTAAVYIASVGDIEYKCSFGGINYILEQCSQLKHIHYENRSFWANCAGDVLTDLLILSIPIIVLWKTRVPLRKKVILLSIFSATVFIMIVAIIRVAVDTTYDQEINVAYVESSIVEYRGKKDFPKSTVHVQSDVEVSTVAVSQIEENKK